MGFFNFVAAVFQRLTFRAGVAATVRASVANTTKKSFISQMAASVRAAKDMTAKWLSSGNLLTRIAKALGVQATLDAVFAALMDVIGDALANIEMDEDDVILAALEEAFGSDGEFDIVDTLKKVGARMSNLSMFDAVIYLAVIIGVVFKSRGKIFEKIAMKYAVGSTIFGQVKFNGQLLFIFGWHKGELAFKTASGKVLFTASQYVKNPIFWICVALAALPTAYWAFIEKEYGDDVTPSPQGDSAADKLVVDVKDSPRTKVQRLLGTNQRVDRYPELSSLRDRTDADGLIAIAELSK